MACRIEDDHRTDVFRLSYLMTLLTYDPYAAPLVTDLLDEVVVPQGLEITVHRGSRYVDLTGGLIYIDEVAVTDHRIYGQLIG